jgi:hypothetical protein
LKPELIIIAGHFAFPLLRAGFPGLDTEPPTAILTLANLSWRLWAKRRLAIAWPSRLTPHPLAESYSQLATDPRTFGYQPIALFSSTQEAYQIQVPGLLVTANFSDLKKSLRELILAVK